VNNYYDIRLKEWRISRLKEKKIKFVRGDLTDSAVLTALFEKYRFTHVCHLAAQAGVRYSLDHPLAYVKSNIEGFTVLMEVVRKQETHPIVVYASSSSVYGKNRKIPFEETDPVHKQRSFYGFHWIWRVFELFFLVCKGATKRANELMAHVYHDLYGIHMTGLRFFTVYGPSGRPDMVGLSLFPPKKEQFVFRLRIHLQKGL
jgi:UDP-glucuronate 4-epimerase